MTSTFSGGSSHHPVDNRDHRVGSTKRNHHADDDLISIELGLRLSQRFLPRSAVAVRCGNSQVELPQLVPIADSWMREWSGAVHYVSANTAMPEITNVEAVMRRSPNAFLRIADAGLLRVERSNVARRTDF